MSNLIRGGLLALLQFGVGPSFLHFRPQNEREGISAHVLGSLPERHQVPDKLGPSDRSVVFCLFFGFEGACNLISNGARRAFLGDDGFPGQLHWRLTMAIVSLWSNHLELLDSSLFLVFFFSVAQYFPYSDGAWGDPSLTDP